MKNSRFGLVGKLVFVSMALLLSITVYAADAVRIMPLGDSITFEDYDGNTQPDSEMSAYRNYLWYELDDAGYNIDFVGSLTGGSAILPPFDTNNEARPGQRDDEMAEEVYSYLVGNPADIVLLHIGTNALDTSAAAVDDILDEIDRYESDHNTSIIVKVAKIINRHVDENATKRTMTTDFNTNVAAMVAGRGDENITMVDMETGAGFVYDDTDMTDMLHPNDAGYEKMADKWHSVLTQHLVSEHHYWRLEEASSPFDDSFGENNATCTTCPAQVAGKVGNAQSFDGIDDNVTVADDDTFNWSASDSFTIEFWMNMPEDHSTTMVAIGRNDTTSDTQWWVGVDSGGQAKFAIRDTNGVYKSVGSSGPFLPTTGWHHIAAVRDAANDEIIIYVDGVEVASAEDISTGDFTATSPANIGHMRGEYYFDGTIDEVAIYNKALTPPQINLQYNGGSGRIYNSHDEDVDGIVDENDNCPNTYNPDRDINACMLMITSEAVTNAVVGEAYSYDVNSSDELNTDYELIVSPPGMTINADTGVISWTPGSGGDFDVTVEGDNGGSNSPQQSFTISVRDLSELPDDMTHYWKLNETEGSPYIDSYAYADGTCSGNDCPAAASGIVDGAQDFDGVNDEVTIADDATFDWGAGDSFTIQAWIKRGSEDLTGSEVVIGRDAPPGQDLNWQIAISPEGKAECYLRDTGGNSVSLADDGSPLTDDVWHHIAVSRDAANDQVSMYVDGVEVDSAADTTVELTGDNTVNIGHLNGSYHFKGVIDEVATYDRALLASQIEIQYTNGSGGSEYGSVDGDGDGFYDESDNCPYISNPDQNASMCKPSPVITTTAVTLGEVDAPYSYDVNTTDVPDVAYRLDVSPTGMTIDPVTGVISWTPTESGTYDVTVTAHNGSPSEDSQPFELTISDRFPVIDTVPVVNGVKGEAYSYDVDAISVPVVTYSLSQSPFGMTIDSGSGVISWTPNVAGDFNVTVMATNGNAPDASQTFELRIIDKSSLPSGMEHYWTLDELEGPTYNDINDTANATCVGAACPVAISGKVDGAQEFDGVEDEVNIADSGNFDWSADDSFTMEFWMKTDQVDSGNSIVVGRYGASSNIYWWVGFDSDTGDTIFRLKDQNGNGPELRNNVAVNDNQWHHIAVVKDGSSDENRLYIDGALAESEVYDYTAGFSDSVSVNVGYLDLGNHYRYEGAVDDLTLYNRALSGEEILNNYTNGFDPEHAESDFNGDGKSDLVWRSVEYGQQSIWYMDGAVKLGGALITAAANPNWDIKGVGDFNGDGIPDLVWRSVEYGQQSIWYMDEHGQKASGALITAPANPNWDIKGVGDFNGDGIPDLVWRSVEYAQNSIWYMNADGQKESGALITAPANPNWDIQGVEDMNGDGIPDLVWRSVEYAQQSIWYMNADGQKESGELITAAANPSWNIVNH